MGVDDDKNDFIDDKSKAREYMGRVTKRLLMLARSTGSEQPI